MRSVRVVVVLCGIWCLAPLPVGAQTLEVEIQGVSGTHIMSSDEAVAHRLGENAVRIFFPSNHRPLTRAECLMITRKDGTPVLSGTARATATTIREDGTPGQTLATKESRLRPWARWNWRLPWDPGIGMEFTATPPDNGSNYSKFHCRVLDAEKCTRDQNTVCAWGQNRFKVIVLFDELPARVTDWGPNWGWFAPPGSQNPTVYVDVTNNCPRNNHFWTGIGSLTSQKFIVSITDMNTGADRSWSNPGKNMVQVDTAGGECP